MAKPAAHVEADEVTSGLWNAFSFRYMNKFVWNSQNMDVEDMSMPTANQAATSYEIFQANWSAELKLKESEDGKKPSLVRALRKSYGTTFALAGVCKFLWSTFVITGAFYFVRSLLAHVRGIKAGRLYSTEVAGWCLAVGFFVDSWFLGLSLQRMGYICMQVGIRVRGALVQTIANKAFRLNTVRQDQSAAIVNFVASDVQKVYDGCMELHYLWTAPIEAAAILALLGYLAGDTMLPGLGVIMLVLPLQYFFGFKIIQIKLATAKHVGHRSGIMQEVLPAIKLVKYYAWEKYFEQEIDKVRQEECKLAFWNAVMKVINVACVFCVPPMTAFTIFTTFEFQSSRLVSTVAFTTLSLFNILRFPLVVLPKALRAVSEAHASLQRLEEYLLEEPPASASTSSRVSTSRRSIGQNSAKNSVGVQIENGVFMHPGQPNWTLNMPRFECLPGQVVAVVGRIGAGKSSLVQAILGNMLKEHGSCKVGGKIAYVPQAWWLQNLSLRDNVVFGEEFDVDRYEAVIDACGLSLDLQILPQGDLSRAGIRGVNFSGGQRQRVNLARAAYADAELLLLDNALSALDHHTAHYVFDKCVKGMFADKAVVMITHQIEFLPRCDAVAIMDEGKCLYFGAWTPHAQEMLSQLLPITHLLHAAGNAEAAPAPKKPELAANKSRDAPALQIAPTSLGLGTQSSTMTAAEKKKAAGENTISEKIGAMHAAGIYLKHGTPLLVGVFFMFFLAAQTTRQVSDFWVRWWVDDKHKQFINSKVADTSGTTFYCLFYLLLVGIFYCCMLCRGSFFLWSVLKASESMRKRAMHAVLHAPMGFFLLTPVGDILLTFTKDQDVLDENLPDAMHFTGIYGLILLSTTITVSVTINFFAAFTGALLFATAIMLAIYLPAATKLKRARSSTGGQLVGLVAEVLEGLAVVQAFGKQDYFIDEASRRTDTTNKCVFYAESLNLWLAFYCDMIGALLVLAVACFAVGLKETLGPATVGLAFSNIIQMLVFYTWVVRYIAESISLFNSVEGMAYLATYVPHDGVHFDRNALNGEATQITLPNGTIVPAKKAVVTVVVDDERSAAWPSSGDIVFEDVWMQYRLETPWALKGVSFHITDGEKVGVVGRTGSGKSTLLLALYRMFELGQGRMIVDGVDTSSLSLKRLRQGLSIIPQEPVMFSGTVRSNLDPFGEFKDDKVLWEVINKVGLEAQTEHAGGLDGRVDGTGGKAWSLGQMQLVCLGRAALRQVPILCLDEATAAMDPHTEQIVQETIHRIFADRTMLIIAHRLDTVIESDKVIVMEQGVLKEMDHPSTLLNNPNSMFSLLVDKSGASAAAALRKLADETFAKKAQAVQEVAAAKSSGARR